MVIIETDRLLLRQYKQDDLNAFVSLNSDEMVMRYFLDTKTAQESKLMMLKLQEDIAKNGYGVFAVELKQTHEFIGFVGLSEVVFDVDFAPAVEIVWRLLPEYWNKGFASEAAKACLKFAKENLPFDKIYAFTTVVNKSSEKVMLKIGMEYLYNFNHPLVPKDHPLLEHKLYVMNFIKKN
ncbi:GNAT family N-acetyltransferase [Myroides injenensis]|uniref:GNAT family N-acetyltransferase n=1 Tax=Myroides injenensis TaxID=1183151 RepID=UPI000288BD1A|nr:GNAT family N-acetyltransferase [Myroides injenensis]